MIATRQQSVPIVWLSMTVRLIPGPITVQGDISVKTWTERGAREWRASRRRKL